MRNSSIDHRKKNRAKKIEESVGAKGEIVPVTPSPKPLKAPQALKDAR
jgi:hypothetical protein